MSKLSKIAGLIGYIILVFVLEWQLERLGKYSTANFKTQIFLWGRSFVDILEAAGLLALSWFVLRSETSKIVAWIFIIIGLLLAFYTPLSILAPSLLNRFIPVISSSEFVGAYLGILGIHLLVARKKIVV